MNHLFELPSSWEWATFGDVARVASNLVSPADYPSHPHIAPNHIEPETGRLLPYSTIEADGVTSPKHLFREGQVLYSKIRPYLAKVTMANFSGLCSADMYPIDAGIDAKYLALWMRSPAFTESASKHQGRSVLPKINKEALAALPVPVPPVTEQRRIVTAAEEQLSRLNRAEEQLCTNQRKLSAYGEQLLLRACSGELIGLQPTSNQPRPSAADCVDGNLPSLPSGWTWGRLGELADVAGGITKDSKKQSDPEFTEVPYLRVANVQRGHLDLTNISTVRAAASKIAALSLNPGDVLLNEGGDRNKLGRGWIWEGQIDTCIHQNHVFRARIHNAALDPKILAWHANSFGRRWFEVNGKQSVNLASISLRKIKQFPVPVPPASLQKCLVAETERHLSVLTKTQTAIQSALNRATALRRSLLTEAFAGRLVPQDPADEPAEELLARIRTEREAAAPKKRRTRRAPAQRKATHDEPPPAPANASTTPLTGEQPTLDLEFPS